MFLSIQEPQLMRYATDAERTEIDRINGHFDTLIKEQIKLYQRLEQEGTIAGYDEKKINEMFNENPDGIRILKGIKKENEKHYKILLTLEKRYIEDAKDNLPLLFDDIKAIRERDIDTSILHYYIIDEIDEKKPKSIPYTRIVKRYIKERILDTQLVIFQRCRTKTEQDKKRLDKIISDFTKQLIDTLTPTQQAAIKKAFNNRHRDKQDTLKPLEKAETFYTPNSYVSNNFTEFMKYFYKENNGQMTFIPQKIEIDITGKSKGYIPVMLSINYEGDITKEGTKSIDYNKARIQGFDTAVLDAICTILETGQNDIYVSAIDALLRGSDKIQKVSPKREERIKLAFRKLGGTRVRLDITNELKSKYDFAALDLKEGILDAAMLEYTGLELTTYAGATTHVIHVEKMPAIYQYSKAKGEITSFPTALLETGERAEERFTTLKLSLLKRITLINKRIMSEKTIRFDTLYKAAGLEEHEHKTQRSREREALVNMLKFWKEQGYIKGYEAYYKGREYVGFKIEPKYIKTDK